MPAFVSDTFSGTAGTLLQSAGWTKHSSATQDAVISTANRARNAGATTGLYYRPETPPSADYVVTATLHPVSLISDSAGVTGRHDTTANTFYLGRYTVFTGAWELYSFVAGTATLLGSYSQTLTAGSAYPFALLMAGTSIKLQVNGVDRVAVTDTAIAAVGKAGLRFGFPSSSAQSDSAGLHLDDFSADEIVAPAPSGPGTGWGVIL